MTVVVGIDVAKLTLDVAVLLNHKSEYLQVSNDELGWIELDKWLRMLDAEGSHICMESTGIYSQGVAHFFHEHGYLVSIVNPLRTRSFARSLLQRNKTDKGDAHTIALYCQRMQPDLWHPKSEDARRLRSLSRLLADLESDRIRCLNRSEGLAEDDPAQLYIQAQIKLLEAQQIAVQADLNALIVSSDELRCQRDLLTSIIGIGEKTANALLGELPDLNCFASAQQLVAYAGLSPQRIESGTSVRRRTKMSKIGATRLRTLLYFPALAARRHCPQLKVFADRLTEAGKAKMVVVGAVMRKLLVLIYAILKSGQPYDRKYTFAA